MRLDFLPQHTSNFTSGCISRMENAPNTVCGFTSEGRLSAGVPVEGDAPLDQLAHVLRTIGHEYSDRAGETEAVAGSHRVGEMEIR